MRNLFKEFGKLIYDIAKIIFAVAIVTPLVKDNAISIYAIFVAVGLIAFGSYIIYKGDE